MDSPHPGGQRDYSYPLLSSQRSDYEYLLLSTPQGNTVISASQRRSIRYEYCTSMMADDDGTSVVTQYESSTTLDNAGKFSRSVRNYPGNYALHFVFWREYTDFPDVPDP